MPVRFRWIGLFPLLFFAIRLIDQWRAGVPQDALWMCNFSNLTLALGLFFAQAAMIRASVLWLLVGLPMWIWYLLQAGHYAWSSWFTHLGALLIGAIALYYIRADRRAWMWAFVGFVVLQQICRMFTPAALNVNMAHGLKVGEFDTVWMSLMSGYWQFWLLSLPLVSACLWLANIIALRLFPPSVQINSN
ncbi:MAG TPA: hypothetical protein VFZ34_25670 [Blastocatellia bacterium]|nr:hypothetical protein [Blastocatellia bacterium]